MNLWYRSRSAFIAGRPYTYEKSSRKRCEGVAMSSATEVTLLKSGAAFTAASCAAKFWVYRPSALKCAQQGNAQTTRRSTHLNKPCIMTPLCHCAQSVGTGSPASTAGRQPLLNSRSMCSAPARVWPAPAVGGNVPGGAPSDRSINLNSQSY